MKTLYGISFLDNGQTTHINVLADTLADAVAHCGNPTVGVSITQLAANVEIPGEDPVRVAPLSPSPIVIGPPQNVPLTNAEIDRFRLFMEESEAKQSTPPTSAKLTSVKEKHT